jgi:hypothetical protein
VLKFLSFSSLPFFLKKYSGKGFFNGVLDSNNLNPVQGRRSLAHLNPFSGDWTCLGFLNFLGFCHWWETGDCCGGEKFSQCQNSGKCARNRIRQSPSKAFQMEWAGTVDHPSIYNMYCRCVSKLLSSIMPASRRRYPHLPFPGLDEVSASTIGEYCKS